MRNLYIRQQNFKNISINANYALLFRPHNNITPRTFVLWHFFA